MEHWAKSGLWAILRSAVGKTHVLRSRLVMNYNTSHFSLIVLGYKRTTLKDNKNQTDLSVLYLFKGPFRGVPSL